VSRSNVCGKKTCCTRKVCVTIHLYCYKVCLMHKHPNAMPNYMAIKIIAPISVVASIINCNASLHGNNHDYCNKIKNHCRVLLQCYYLLPLLTKVTLLLLEGVATNMTLLQPYFTMAIDQFSNSVPWFLASLFHASNNLGSSNLQVYPLLWSCSETAKTRYSSFPNWIVQFFRLVKFGNQHGYLAAKDDNDSWGTCTTSVE
jgi:hypothetical protein